MKRCVLLLTLACSFLSAASFIPFKKAFRPNTRFYKTHRPPPTEIAYNLNHFAKVDPSEDPRIPKMIHIIWLGSPLPKKYEPFIASWKKHHPEWEVKLWTDDDIGSFPLVTGEKIYEAKNFGQRSDIFRYEILYAFGGLYVDTDFYCLKPHDILHHTCDFYTAMDEITIYNGIIGSAPGHPIIERCLKSIKKIKKMARGPTNIVVQTGPLLLCNKVMHHLKQFEYGAIVYPTIYFYGFPGTMRERFWQNDEPNFEVAKPYITQNAFAMHMWALSWKKKS